jgi:hypothetical protein
LLTLAVAYVIALCAIRLFEAHFLFFPNVPGRLDGSWNPPGLGIEDVRLTTSDGVKLHAWWIPRGGARFTFLAFHGNAANIANRADAYGFLAGLPANILAVEYRGYGKSEGKPSEAGLYRDAQAGYQFLLSEKAIRPEQIVSFGQSLGTAIATHLAAQNKVGALVLEAPFPSASAVARCAFWFMPGISLLVYGQLDTGVAIRSVNAPVMVVHCTQDPVIPFELGRAVFEQAHSPKFFVEIEGYCHEEASLISPGRYKAALTSFLESIGPLR